LLAQTAERLQLNRDKQHVLYGPPNKENPSFLIVDRLGIFTDKDFVQAGDRGKA